MTNQDLQNCDTGCDTTAIDTPEERTRRTVAPRSDIFENEAGVTLVADMPGVARDDLSITLEENKLTIVGRVSYEAFEGYTLRYAEFEPADYRRTFVLSERVDPEGITATLKNGQLRLALPKRQPTQKEIPVTVS